ncbi:ABC transporter ATP-binding protein/permease [Peptoniphilus sp. MSJ-1]|uniref:ABC transporter ATP-binding protein/permease n=1 Tax=Peptoniphilus ovalis TaxID=2841503 RepID=A0ABS6FH17_9FIRM|nr:ABC transporter ATP-binding protein/permease [Peptoniphilus ovalis]MBU5669449.1 ABC transporter ATP-binding protein/permease [Peptoniphilus ovalis]
MFDKRLFKELKSEKIYLIILVVLKVMEMILNVFMIFSLSKYIENLIEKNNNINLLSIILFIIIARIFITKIYYKISFKVSTEVKNILRQRLIKKVYSFKMSFVEKIRISEIINLGVEGIEQLNIFYSEMLPQLFFSLIGPLILFIIVSFLNFKIAIIMLAIVPVIPIAILMVQKLANKVVKSYWKSYTDLSDVFIDFLYGLTTLKVFNADKRQNEKLNEYAEDFRVKTMKLLMVQLNNITVMDIVSYCGMGLGIILSLVFYNKGEISIFAAISIVLLAQEFFTPLRRLGSLFHVAMNGISAAKSIFKILETEDEKEFENYLKSSELNVKIKDLNFSYDKKLVLDNVNLEFKKGSITAIVGESGSGKSTIVKVLSGILKPNSGEIYFNGMTDVNLNSLLENIMMIDNEPYIFNESLRYNLKIAKEDATDLEILNALDKVGLKTYFENGDGLDTILDDLGTNLSGGQKQRLSFARAILKSPKLLILDESISNIDIESEELILNLLEKMKKEMNIILITHRLKNTEYADYIYYLEDGKIKEEGKFNEILKGRLFSSLYNYQISLEKWGLYE